MATPGRLIAHLESTPGFSLRHLRFLIVDETDRLLRQAYQGWLPKVMAALHGGSGSSGASSASSEHQQGSEEQQQQQQQDAPQPARRVVKFVVSATLTRDPSKIDRLQLTCPRYIAMSAGGQQAAGWAGGVMLCLRLVILHLQSCQHPFIAFRLPVVEDAGWLAHGTHGTAASTCRMLNEQTPSWGGKRRRPRQGQQCRWHCCGRVCTGSPRFAPCMNHAPSLTCSWPPAQTAAHPTTLRTLLVVTKCIVPCPVSPAVDHRYKLPRSLQEAKLVVPAERKPAALAALLQVGAKEGPNACGAGVLVLPAAACCPSHLSSAARCPSTLFLHCPPAQHIFPPLLLAPTIVPAVPAARRISNLISNCRN